MINGLVFDFFRLADLHIYYSVLRSKDKVFVSLNAVGVPAPMCSCNNTHIKCVGGKVELTRDQFIVHLTAKNTAGMEKSCRQTFNFGRTHYCFSFLNSFLSEAFHGKYIYTYFALVNFLLACVQVYVFTSAR